MDELVFVSYARADGEFALRLARDLRAANVKIWIDQLDILAGETWDRAVEDALRRCTGLLVVLSPHSVSSRSVMDEVSFALDENKRILPVLYKACEIPFRLRRVQRTDFTSDYAAGLSRLVDALNGAPVASVTHEDGGRDAPSSRRSYWLTNRPRFVTAQWVGLIGAILGGAGEAMIYARDERVGTSGPSLFATVFGGGLIAGLLWAVAGAVAGPRRFPLIASASTSLIVLAGWIGFFGTYNDVLGAAVILGWPVGGIVGAAVGSEILKMRGQS